ncbi:hypothetical protein ACOMHN_062312 [Nucella lapillus]
MAEHTTPKLCADEGEQTSSNKLQPTLDDSQKRFSCGIEELTVWRNVLLYRYSAVSHPSFYIKTVDYDHDMNELSLNLHKACQLLDVAIIDNTSSFVAPSGAPRLALYRDPFHPSVQGTAKLAVSMKKMLANWQPDHFWRSDPGRSDRRN